MNHPFVQSEVIPWLANGITVEADVHRHIDQDVVEDEAEGEEASKHAARDEQRGALCGVKGAVRDPSAT
eukprot:CAMPEP_0174741448 /NCGR_PEP_ID=MMETSP1094-20130205/76370_1 /TAXON_ID=156173 /ORGANISM="Chrysochromulina brevifilum, Strain UTEX LB 985" /LENGTH=68 /DNA_ID=CAMNT_0015945343 /DNA_START=440 /DNA_END=649 /DNA_ORIENTATION=-